MHTTIMILVATLRETFLSRASLHLENLALRQQVAILKRERRRPWLQTLDRLFWVILSRLWPRWREALVIVRPETVIGWHRKGFRAFWTWKSRRGKPGRPPVPKDVRELIRRMCRENPLWGAPRIHGEYSCDARDTRPETDLTQLCFTVPCTAPSRRGAS